MLEHLSIHVGDSLLDAYHANSVLPLFNSYTPRLQYCSFASFNFAWDVRVVSFLRVLKLDGYWHACAPSTPVILDMLRACPHLEELSLRNLSDLEGESCGRFHHGSRVEEALMLPASASVVQLPRLKKATFSCAGATRIRALLTHLALPGLESLELAYLDDVNPLLGCFERQALTSLPLRHLRIESCCFSELTLVRFLARVPSLTSLELVDTEDASSHLMKVSAPYLASRGPR